MSDKVLQAEVSETATEETVKPETQANENIGKFPNKEELFAAYNALEKEFTRRSQRLKTLEKQIDDIQKANLQREEEGEAKDKFLKNLIDANADLEEVSKEIREAISDVAISDEQAVWAAVGKTLALHYRSVNSLLADKDFVAQALSSDDVLDACAEKFFGAKSVKNPPKTVGGNGRSVITLPNKPKSLKEAKELAEKIFK